ncbi:replication protein O [Caballeronia sp. Lep1P3]|uniref:replication protein O n=1 Tax=Caballeronia sp. Lep1P3 TaxID=2878150 RepID=UPI001FD44B41|nr:replication protein O [Caballeronia sp. Lep1P3]
MHIAQPSVAGEDVSRPHTSEAPGVDPDQQAANEYACDRSNLPWVIFRAAHRANHIAALPARARAVLSALARTVDAGRPFAAIFARRELLTGRALQSMRTFYRSLDDLETAGLIMRPPQTRYGGAGLFGRAYLHLTSKAASLLGLVSPQQADRSALSSCHETARHNGPADSLASPCVTVADGAIYKDLSPTTQKRQPGTLPHDLIRLRQLGFREFLIFKLMREASDNGKRLSDVVEATWTHLQRAKRPISYLRALLRVPVDFAYRVHISRSEAIAHDERRHRDSLVEQQAKTLAGQAFESHDGLRRYFVADDATTVTIEHRDEQRPRVHAGAWASDFIAALRAGLILRTDLRTDQTANSPTVRPRQHDHAARARITDHLDAMKQALRLKGALTGTISAIGKDRPPTAQSKVRSASARLFSHVPASSPPAVPTTFDRPHKKPDASQRP